MWKVFWQHKRFVCFYLSFFKCCLCGAWKLFFVWACKNSEVHLRIFSAKWTLFGQDHCSKKKKVVQQALLLFLENSPRDNFFFLFVLFCNLFETALLIWQNVHEDSKVTKDLICLFNTFFLDLNSGATQCALNDDNVYWYGDII